MGEVLTKVLPRKTDPRTDPGYRPYQPFGSAERLFYCHDAEILLSGPAGTGKALFIDTPLLTLSGWRTMGTVKVGDYVFHPSGVSVKVTGVSEVFTNHDCYEIEFSDHSTITADSSHEWEVRGMDERKYPQSKCIIRTTEEMNESMNFENDESYSVDVCNALQYPISNEHLIVHPYLLGYWLGDGYSSGWGFITMDEDVVKYIKDNTNHVVSEAKPTSSKKTFGYSVEGLTTMLGVYGLISREKGHSKKHIPRVYLETDYANRLQLLQGLMDSDGCCDIHGNCHFDNKNTKLIADFMELIAGLGIKYTHDKGDIEVVDGKIYTPENRIRFSTEIRVFNIERKYKKQHAEYAPKLKRRTVKRIIRITSVPVRCIKVDSEDGLFLAGRSLITTHNSRAVLEKLNLCACKYPGMRGLIVRKTRESITQSAMVTLEKFVIPQNGGVHFRTSEQEYRFQNGSTIVLGGMDRASKILSSEYDMIYCQQIEELDVEDYETLITRNRLGTMPYNQIIGDCNPSYPKHWLKQKADAGLLTYINSIHEDNPILYDHAMKQWTPRGIDYIKKLDGLTGVRKKRLRYGLWAAAEGIIFDEWQSPIHLINHFDPPDDWIRLWVVDFGFTAPLVWQAWALDEENDIAYMFAEIYHTKLLVEDAAAQIKAWRIAMHEQIPTAIICDHDAEGRETLVRHLDIETEAADKAISDGIQSVKTRMRLRENGKPGLYIMRDSLLDVDTELDDSGKPICTIDEIDSYEWQDPKRKDREGPRQVDDHGMDAMRYFCKYLEGEFGGWSQGMGG